MAIAFTWNGISSDTMGIYVQEQPPIIRPKERITNVTIPGRAGDLTLTQGDDIYEPYLKNCKCIALADCDIHALCTWLRGSGTVIFGNEQNFIYKARIVNQISFDKLYNNGIKEFTIPFYVQPYKIHKDYADTYFVTLTTSGSTITNPGDVASRPIIKLLGQGNIKLKMNGTSVTLTGISTGIVLDWDEVQAKSIDGSTNLNTKVSGSVQTLGIGENTVSWSVTSTASGDGVSSVDIYPHWRYI